MFRSWNRPAPASPEMKADWMSKIWIKEDRSMKKLVVILNSGLFGRNGALLCAIVALVLTGLFAAACAKSEIAQDDSIMNAAQAAAAGETQDDPAGDDQGSSDDPQGDPADPESPSQHGSDYISPDHFNMVQMTFGACSDAEEDTRSTGLFSRESALEREEPLDDSVQETFSVKTSLDGSGNILWTQGDKIKVYYAEGESNFNQGTVKHGGESSSTIDAEVNDDLDYFYAFYPVGVTTSATFETADPKTYGSITVTIPNPQNATDNNFASCHMAVGKASKAEKQFAFSNVGSYLKMQVADLTATSLTIKSIAGENITGTFTVPFTDADGTIGTPTVDSGSSEITVNLPSGRPSPITIYVMLLPGVNFTKGFLVHYNYQDGITRPSFVYDSGKEVVRRKVLNLGGLDGRIITDWFFKSDGTRTNPSGREALPSGSKATCGSSWDLALSATGLYNLLNANADADLRKAQAARLDGATLHFANGTYTVPEMVLNGTGYGENVNLTMYGGYPTTHTGTSTSNRSTDNRASIISGGGTNRIFDMGTKFEVTMDNFELTGGKVDGSTTTGDGGAIQMQGASATDCKLTVNHVWFYDNYVANQPDGMGSGVGSGGAIALKKGTLTATNCIFEKGSARNGGGVFVTGQPGANAATAVLTDCSFIDNETQSNCGAGLSANGGQISLTRCSFTGNHAAQFGGGLHWDIGDSVSPSMELSNCTFEGNYTNDATVDAHGGAISCQSGTLTLSNCSFMENHAGANNSKGGAIWVQGNVSGSNLTFTDNYASGDGGAVYVNNSGQFSMLSGENSFSGNYSGYVDADTFADTEGGAIYMAGSGSSVHIKGNTSFQENYSLKRAGAISFRGGTLKVENDGDNRPSFFKNNTIVEYESGDVISNVNGGAVGIYATTGTVTLTGCDFDANYLMGDADFANCYAEGGSLAISAGSATNLTVSVTDCLFTNSYSGTSTLNNEKSATARNGGAFHFNIKKDNAGTISFSNCRFTNNRAWNCGGVATHPLGTVHFSNCQFTGNTAKVFSGVHHMNHEDATANFNNCIFTDNSSWNNGTGSVCRLENGTLTLTSCTLSGNQSLGTSGSGVISMCGPNSNLIVRGSTIEDNTARSGNGGAIYFGNGSLTITSSDGTASGTKSVIRGNTGNSSGRGYAIYVNGNNESTLTPSLSYCIFDAKNSSGDVAPTSGTAIHFAGTTGSEALTMTGCEIKNFNRATNTDLWWTNLLDAANHTAASTLSFNACTFEALSSPGNGGVFEYYPDSPFTISSIAGCTFRNNYANNNGGAIYTQSDLAATDCVFTGNEAKLSGGAIYIKMDVQGWGSGHEGFAEHSVSSHGATFSSNTAQWGGAVYVESGRYFADDATFTGNKATTNDGGTYIAAGGGVCLYGVAAQATFNRCTFTGNEATNQRGGAIAQSEAVTKINECTFSGNKAALRGGAFFGLNWGFCFVNNSKFVNNSLTSSGYGSAIFFSGFGWLMGNGLLVAENTVSAGNQSPISGSGRLLLSNCTFLGKLTDGSSGIIRFENSYGKIFHSIVLPTDNSTSRNAVLISGGSSPSQYLNGYYSVLDGVQNLNSVWTAGDGTVTGKRPANLSNYSWDSTNKMYSWNGTVSDYTNYASTSAMWTAIGSAFSHTDAIPSPTSSPDYYFFEFAPADQGGLGKTFLDWLDECGGSTAGDGVGRNKDILGNTRADGNNYPGCRAY